MNTYNFDHYATYCINWDAVTAVDDIKRLFQALHIVRIYLSDTEAAKLSDLLIKD